MKMTDLKLSDKDVQQLSEEGLYVDMRKLMLNQMESEEEPLPDMMQQLLQKEFENQKAWALQIDTWRKRLEHCVEEIKNAVNGKQNMRFVSMLSERIDQEIEAFGIGASVARSGSEVNDQLSADQRYQLVDELKHYAYKQVIKDDGARWVLIDVLTMPLNTESIKIELCFHDKQRFAEGRNYLDDLTLPDPTDIKLDAGPYADHLTIESIWVDNELCVSLLLTGDEVNLDQLQVTLSGDGENGLEQPSLVLRRI